MRGLLIAAAVALAAGAQAEPQGNMLSLSCMEALVAVDQAGLAGVFSFVPEKDSAAAFADLVAHVPAALKKFVKKADRDLRQAGGISIWDHDVVMALQMFFSSPLAQTVEKPSGDLKKRLVELSAAPTLTLDEISTRRRR